MKRLLYFNKDFRIKTRYSGCGKRTVNYRIQFKIRDRPSADSGPSPDSSSSSSSDMAFSKLTVSEPVSFEMTQLRVAEPDEMAWVRQIVTSKLLVEMQQDLVLAHLDAASKKTAIPPYLARRIDGRGDTGLPRLPSETQSIYFSRNFRGDDRVSGVEETFFRVELRDGGVRLFVVQWDEKEAVHELVQSDTVQNVTLRIANQYELIPPVDRSGLALRPPTAVRCVRFNESQNVYHE